jgi:hypothetical protein
MRYIGIHKGDERSEGQMANWVNELGEAGRRIAD